jgi:tetratricopeptide (TPR) repeat protein
MKLVLAMLLMLIPALAMAAPAEDPIQLVVEGNAYYHDKKFAQALQFYKQSWDMGESTPDALRGIANCLFSLGQKQDALDKYRQLLKIQPGDQTLAQFVSRLDEQLNNQVPVPPALAENTAQSPASLAPLPSQQPDWFASFWRSAICPGWGQAYNNEDTKAWLLGGTTWALLGAVGVTYAMRNLPSLMICSPHGI